MALIAFVLAVALSAFALAGVADAPTPERSSEAKAHVPTAAAFHRWAGSTWM